jgi:hypothetical protein
MKISGAAVAVGTGPYSKATPPPCSVLCLLLLACRKHGYRGVVVGWDVGCCEDEGWQQAARAADLKKGLRWAPKHVLSGAEPRSIC